MFTTFTVVGRCPFSLIRTFLVSVRNFEQRPDCGYSIKLLYQVVMDVVVGGVSRE